MKRWLLLTLFVGLMADSMFGWGLGIAPGVSLKNALLYVLVLVMAIETAITGGKSSVELPHIHLLFIMLIALALLSWAVSTFVGSYIDYSPLRSFIAWKGSLLDHYLFFLVFFIGVRSEPDVQWLHKWLFIFIAAANILTVLDAYKIPDLAFIETKGDGRVQGPLGEANQYGLFVALMLPFLLARAWSERGYLRAFLGAGAAASFLVMLLTVSRGAFLSLVAGSLFAVVFLRDHMNAKIVQRTFAIGFVAILGAALVLGQDYANLIIERTQETTFGGDTYAMTSGRTLIWSKALGIMMEDQWSLLTGYGWNTFRSVMAIAPHNVYLHRFFELGIFGLIVFLALLFSVLHQIRKALDNRKRNSSLDSSLIGFVFGFAILVIGIFAVDLANPWYFVWAFAGIAMRAGILVTEVPVDEAPKSQEMAAGQHPDASLGHGAKHL